MNTTWLLKGLRFLVGLGLLFVASWPLPHARGQDAPLQVEDALKIIRHWEANRQRLEWKVETRDGRLKDSSDRNTASMKETYTKCSVVCEPHSRRFRVDMEGVMKWIDGPAPYGSQRSGFSFDGTERREFRSEQPGKVIPPFGKGSSIGWIDAKSSRQTPSVQDWMMVSGAYQFPPYVFGRQLSDLIVERQARQGPLRITQGADSVWTIWMEDIYPIPDRFINIRFDPAKGVMIGVTWTVKLEDNSTKEFKQLYVDLAQTDTGFWIPTVIDCVNFYDKTITREVYSDVKINQPVPDEVFRLTFPIGTKIKDDIEQKSYVVGNGSVNDEAAILAYAQLHGLRMDEESPKTSSKLANALRPALVVSAVILLVLLTVLTVILLFRKRKLRKTTVLTLLFLLFVSPDPAPAVEINDGGDWVIKHGNREEIHISQCGLNVTLLALNCFGTNYNLPRVCEALPPTKEGVRFADIQTLLEAHGLKCMARKDVSLRDVKTAVQPGMMAIYPIRTPMGPNHYLAVINHPKYGELLLDPPSNSPVALEKVLDNADLQPLQGVVLFIGRDRHCPVQANQIMVSPEMIDLGTFSTTENNAKAEPVTITLTNNSQSPVMISHVISPCGCISPEWKGGVLPANESREVTFHVIRGAWGHGRLEKNLVFVFADKSTSAFTVKGGGVAGKQDGEISISSDLIQIDLDKLSHDTQVVEKCIKVHLNEALVGVIPQVASFIVSLNSH